MANVIPKQFVKKGQGSQQPARQAQPVTAIPPHRGSPAPVKRTGPAIGPATVPPVAKKGGKVAPPPPAATPITALKADSLPIVSTFNRADMDASIALMNEDVEIQEQVAAFTARRAEIKAELAAVAERHHVDGFRHGQIAVYYGGQKTKWSLNRAMLIENGVTPQQLEDSMKESKPFVDLRVVDLAKPRKGGGEEE